MVARFQGASLLALGAIACGFFSGSPAIAGEFKGNAVVGVELRAFPENPEWPGQDDRHFYPSIFGEFDLSYSWDENRQAVSFVPFGRFDLYDDRRTHVDVREGYAESLPVEDGEIDVVISNGVINLCPDKQAVFREMFRVLRPGGRIQVGDILVHLPVPQEAKDDIELWSG